MPRKPLHRMQHQQAPRLGVTLLEVLVAMAILTAGLLSMAAFFPRMLNAAAQAEIETVAAALAQQKAEEIRRDDTPDRDLVTAIQQLDSPTDPIVYTIDPRLTYSFSGQSLLFSNTGVDNDPRATPGVARVIVRYAPSYRPTQDVIYELRFN